jgi:hypothetical protein
MCPGNNSRGLFVAQVGFKSFQAHSSGANLQEAAYNDPDHTRQKPVGADLKPKAFSALIFPQMGGADPADRMFEACRRLAKSVIILVLRQQSYRSFH